MMQQPLEIMWKKVYYYGRITQDNKQITEGMLFSCRENTGNPPCEVVYTP